MVWILVAALAGFAPGASFAAQDGDAADLAGRLRVAMQIARERNDRSLVEAVETLAREFKRGLPADADSRLREVEHAVGIDPGGWSMAGQPLFKPTRAMESELKAAGPRLKEAMMSGDAAAVRRVTADMLAILGDQAGVPDGRRLGRVAQPLSMSEAGATRLFLDALESKGEVIRGMSEGNALPDQMLRVYADLLCGVSSIRPLAAQHQPDALGRIDALAGGLAALLVRLQQPEGHFPFPDLRGRNIRFGDMIQKQIDAGQSEVRDGWVVTPEPDGGTQFDTGVCGTALLLAGQAYERAEWRQAGLRAAAWAMAQPCCANFNYNAFSVSLLANAFRITGERKCLDAALRKFRVGVAPGQAQNGRWIDPHNARTVYHVIILRALGDLGAVLPLELRPEVDAVAKPAVKALLDEFDAMGITVEALPELLTLKELYPDDARLGKAVQTMAGSIVGKCTDGKRIVMASAPGQLAVVPRAAAGK